MSAIAPRGPEGDPAGVEQVGRYRVLGEIARGGMSGDGGTSYGGLLANATVRSADGVGGVRRLNRDDDAPASAGTQSVGGDGPAKKVTLGAGYSQMDWMRLTKRDPDLAGLKGASRKRKITMEEVATHRTPEDGWTAFRGKVYNLTPYLNFHPGGDKILKGVLGKDCTAQFDKAAVKKVFGADHHDQLRPRVQPIDPLDRFVNVDEFVFIALHYQPGALRL